MSSHLVVDYLGMFPKYKLLYMAKISLPNNAFRARYNFNKMYRYKLIEIH